MPLVFTKWFGCLCRILVIEIFQVAELWNMIAGFGKVFEANTGAIFVFRLDPHTNN